MSARQPAWTLGSPRPGPIRSGGGRPARLVAAGEAILSDAKTYGAHLDNPAIGNAPVEQELSRLQRTIREDDNFTAERKAREQQSEPVDRHGEAEKPAETDTAPARPDARTLYEALERDWSRIDERADQAGISVFDMEGSEALIARMRSLTENPDLPAGAQQVLAGVLENYQQHVASAEPGHGKNGSTPHAGRKRRRPGRCETGSNGKGPNAIPGTGRAAVRACASTASLVARIRGIGPGVEHAL